jgi:hypothetical protein
MLLEHDGGFLVQINQGNTIRTGVRYLLFKCELSNPGWRDLLLDFVESNELDPICFFYFGGPAFLRVPDGLLLRAGCPWRVPDTHA